MLQFAKGRVHVKTTVPPGDSLVGILPFNVMRLERAKLSENARLELLTAEHRAVPFDGNIHDLRGDCGTTLTIGSHVSLFVRNRSDHPEPLELQVLGTVVDGQEREEGQPAPEVGHAVVLGVFAQEMTLEREEAGHVSLSHLLAGATDNHARAKGAAMVAFGSACLRGETADFDALDQAEAHRDRCHRLLVYLQASIAREREAEPDQTDTLGFSPEDYDRMLEDMAKRAGKTIEQVRAEVAERAADPSKRPRAGLTFDGDGLLEGMSSDDLGAVVSDAAKDALPL